MNAAWCNFMRLCSRREDGTSLALLRIFIGLVGLYSLSSVAAASLLDVLWAGEQHGGFVHRSGTHWLWKLLSSGPPTPNELWAVWTGATGGFALMTAGLGGRWPLLVAQQCYVALTGLNGDASGGYDSLIAIGVVVLCFSDCNSTLSVDCWRRSGKWSSTRRVTAWPRYLLAAQLLVMYCATGFQKIGPSWTPMGGYTALHYVLIDPTWTRFDSEWVPVVTPLLRVGTAVTWHWEQASIVMLLVLYFRATRGSGRVRRWLTRFDLRIAWAVVGVALHVGILALLNVGPFSWISLAYYVALWSGGELRRGAARLRLAFASHA